MLLALTRRALLVRVSKPSGSKNEFEAAIWGIPTRPIFPRSTMGKNWSSPSLLQHSFDQERCDRPKESRRRAGRGRCVGPRLSTPRGALRAAQDERAEEGWFSHVPWQSCIRTSRPSGLLECLAGFFDQAVNRATSWFKSCGLKIDVSSNLQHDRADPGLKPKESKGNVRSVKGLIVDNLERGVAGVKGVDERFWLVWLLKTEAEIGSALIGVEFVRQWL